MQLVLIIATLHLFACLSPGPDILLVVRNSSQKGFPEGLATTAGILAGVSLQILLGLTGISYIITQHREAQVLVAMAGASWLITIGLQGLLPSLQRRETAPAVSPAQRYNRSYFLQGLFVNLLNPKAMLFFLGLYSALLGPEVSMILKVLCAAAQLTVQAAAFSLIAWLMARAGGQMRAWPQLQRALDLGTASLLLIIGLWIWTTTLISLAA